MQEGGKSRQQLFNSAQDKLKTNARGPIEKKKNLIYLMQSFLMLRQTIWQKYKAQLISSKDAKKRVKSLQIKTRSKLDPIKKC